MTAAWSLLCYVLYVHYLHVNLTNADHETGIPLLSHAGLARLQAPQRETQIDPTQINPKLCEMIFLKIYAEREHELPRASVVDSL